MSWQAPLGAPVPNPDTETSMTERRVRSKLTDLTLIPLIQWEVQDNGRWRDLKAPKNPRFPEPFDTFTLNITIEHGK